MMNNKIINEIDNAMTAEVNRIVGETRKKHMTESKRLSNENQELRSMLDELKDENRTHADQLDEKDDEIKQLHIDLCQKSSEVDNHQSSLSHDMNSLKGKLSKAEQTIKDLESKIDQTKINNLEAMSNEIALLKNEKLLGRSTSPAPSLSRRPQTMDYGVNTIPDYDIPKPDKVKYVPSQKQKDKQEFNRVAKLDKDFPRLSSKKKLDNFKKILSIHYTWSSRKGTNDIAPIPFQWIHDIIVQYCEEHKQKSSGERAYFPTIPIMIDYLKTESNIRFGERISSSPDMSKDLYNGRGSSKKMRFDLKKK